MKNYRKKLTKKVFDEGVNEFKSASKRSYHTLTKEGSYSSCLLFMFNTICLAVVRTSLYKYLYRKLRTIFILYVLIDTVI